MAKGVNRDHYRPWWRFVRCVYDDKPQQVALLI